MKRKTIFFTFVLTALILSGCTQNNSDASQNSTASEPIPSTSNEMPQDTAQTTTPSPSPTAQNDLEKGTMLSEENAREIALSHANLTAEQVTFIKSGLDRDNGIQNYDVEFYTQDQKEYDYEIDPYSGEILHYDYDAEYYEHSSDNTSNKEEISADAAKEIVLKQVPGATVQDIHEFESDYDNGKLHFEGKLFYEQTEYEFEIDGYNGDILEWDVEPIYGGVS